MTITDKIAPIHPGEVLLEDFIEGFGITQNKVAVAIGVPPGASMRSCTANEESQPIQLRALPATLAQHRSFG